MTANEKPPAPQTALKGLSSCQCLCLLKIQERLKAGLVALRVARRVNQHLHFKPKGKDSSVRRRLASSDAGMEKEEWDTEGSEI